MEKAISASEANRRFSELLREVREGHSYVVTSHGKPVARISPPQKGKHSSRSRKAFLHWLEAQPVRNVGRWTRDELYER